MATAKSVKNQYFGINAHLHSYWQTVGGWSDFHSAHIADISKTLKARLLPMGYTTEIEQSLQIRRVDDSREWPESDVTIYDLLRERPPTGDVPPAVETDAGTVVFPLSLLVDETPTSEKSFGAVAVYEYIPRKRDRGEPVVWIELLSPTNKGKGADATKYLEKRRTILESGIVFVEIDYLHETPSTFARLPSYGDIENNGGLLKHRTPTQEAHPYRIVVLDPRPTLQAGKVYLGEFDVDAPIPTVPIPLNGNDQLPFDFGVPYQKTFEEELYGLEFVDYQELPERFARYEPADQARIAAKMLAVLQAVQNGVDLETGPFTAESLPLDEALAKIEAWQR